MSVTLVALALAASPAFTVWERQTQNVPSSAVQTVELRVRESLAEQALEVAEGFKACGAEKDCLLARARETESVAIGLSIAKGRKGLLVDLQATAPDGTDLAAVTFPLPSKGDRKLPEVDAFAKQLAAAWKARPVKVEPEPVALAPVVDEAPVEVVEVPTSFWTVPTHVTLWTGVVTGVAAIGLGVAGAVVKGALDTSLAQQPPVLSRPQALEQASLANGLLTASLFTAVAAAISVVFFTILFVVNGS